ncbi:MAG: glycosidase, partial [Catalinimonas sp.]
MEVTRLPLRLAQDPRRVILTYLVLSNEGRIYQLIDDVAALSDEEVQRLLAEVYARFQHRHTHFEEMIEEHYARAIRQYAGVGPATDDRRRLLGAYFSKEYSNQAVALFNPSIVPHPDQTGVAEGSLRFIMSLRATGEGHLSSIEFRSGTVDAAGDMTLDTPTGYSQLPEH